jgi:hypothetical protein
LNLNLAQPKVKISEDFGVNLANSVKYDLSFSLPSQPPIRKTSVNYFYLIASKTVPATPKTVSCPNPIVISGNFSFGYSLSIYS